MTLLRTRTASTAPAARGLVLAAATALTLGLSACSSGPSTTPTPTGAVAAPGPAATGPHNAADISFATRMIPHHRQALQMATMALSTSSDPDLLALARRIQGEQAPEIATMTGWLTGWGAPVPADSGRAGGTSGTAGMTGMSGTPGMTGMMSEADMSRLAAATGAGFDGLWLTLMVEHHEGAVTMARTELSDGSSAAAAALAQSIIDGQSAEIALMRGLLSTPSAVSQAS